MKKRKTRIALGCAFIWFQIMTIVGASNGASTLLNQKLGFVIGYCSVGIVGVLLLITGLCAGKKKPKAIPQEKTKEPVVAPEKSSEVVETKPKPADSSAQHVKKPAKKSEPQIVDIEIFNAEERGATYYLDYFNKYSDGSRIAARQNVKNLRRYDSFRGEKQIVSAECYAKVECGRFKIDNRIVFIVKTKDGTAALVQAQEGSQASMVLFGLSAQPFPEDAPSAVVSTPKGEPYDLKENELPQGTYLVGRDIPPGIYDFFVTYGHGGSFTIEKLDKAGEAIAGTWKMYWIGLNQPHEDKELIHVSCQEGYTITIRGNVIVTIAKAKEVNIVL